MDPSVAKAVSSPRLKVLGAELTALAVVSIRIPVSSRPGRGGARRTGLARESTDITLQLASRPVLPPLLQARLSDRRDQMTAFLCSYPETS